MAMAHCRVPKCGGVDSAPCPRSQQPRPPLGGQGRTESRLSDILGSSTEEMLISLDSSQPLRIKSCNSKHCLKKAKQNVIGYPAICCSFWNGNKGQLF